MNRSVSWEPYRIRKHTVCKKRKVLCGTFWYV